MFELIEFRELQDNAAREALKSTCQNFIIQDGKLKPNGCGVFIVIDNFHFLLTAAHVYEGNNFPIYVNTTKHGLITLGGEINVNVTLTERRQDRIDSLIIKLDQATIDLLEGSYEYLRQFELGINHELVETPMYISVGFPASKSKMVYKERNKIVSTPYSFCTKVADESTYKKLSCNKNANIIVQYSKNKVRDSQTMTQEVGPDLYGISGSGLWFTPLQNKDRSIKVEKKLVAIMTEWSRENTKYLIGTRIDFFTEVIRKKYCLDFEQSNLVEISIDLL